MAKRYGEGGISKNSIPTKHELQSEVLELINSVKGAVIARIQLGFD